MAPISSIATAFALPTTAPSVHVDPGAAEQSASTMSPYLVGTGGLLFAAVAIVSIAGYFHHGRKKTQDTQRNSTWVTFNKLFTSLRHRGSGTATIMPGSDWPADVEGGPEHVSAVYTRCFHPTHWNLIESHPATPSAPAIYVEDEAEEIPASKPKSLGMNSLLDSHGDEGEGGKNNGTRDARENMVQDADYRVEEISPYVTRSATNVGFKSKIIGTTDRPGGAFLFVPGQYRDGSSESSSTDDASQTLPGGEISLNSSLHDGIVTEPEIDVAPLTRPPRIPEDAFETLPDSHTNLVYSYDGSLTDTELPYYRNQTDSREFIYSSDGGVTVTSSSPGQSCEPTETVPFYPSYGRIVVDSQPDISREPIRKQSSRSFRSTRRYGIADMSDFARTLEAIPEEGHGLVRTINCRSGLCDLADFGETYSEMQTATPSDHLDRLKPGDDKSRTVQGGRDDFRKRWADPDTFGPLYEGLDQLQRIIDELDDSDAEDGDLEDEEDEEGTASCLASRVIDAQDAEGSADGIDPATSYSRLVQQKPKYEKQTGSSNDVGDDFRKDRADSDTFGPLFESLDLLQQFIDELDNSDAEDSAVGDVDERSVSGLIPTWGVDNSSQESLEWSSSISDEASIGPVTPAQRSTMTLPWSPYVHQACVGPPVTPRFDEVQVFVPTRSRPPPWLPCKAYVRTHGPRRPLLMVHDSPPPMSATIHTVTPSVYVESPIIAEEVQAIPSGSPPGFQSKAYVCTHRRSRPLLMVCDSPPQVSASLQVVAPSGYNVLVESQVTPWFTEEAQAAGSGSSPLLQSEAYVRPDRSRHPQLMVCGPYLLPPRY